MPKESRIRDGNGVIWRYVGGWVKPEVEGKITPVEAGSPFGKWGYVVEMLVGRLRYFSYVAKDQRWWDAWMPEHIKLADGAYVCHLAAVGALVQKVNCPDGEKAQLDEIYRDLGYVGQADGQWENEPASYLVRYRGANFVRWDVWQVRQ